MPRPSIGWLSLLIGAAAFGGSLPPSRITDSAHATDLIEVADGWVLATDHASGPGEWSGRLVRLDRSGNVLDEAQVVTGMGPRVAFSGTAYAVAFDSPGQSSSALLRLIGKDLEGSSTVARLGGSSTHGTAVAWHPSRREWAVAVSEYSQSDVTVRLQRYSEHELSPLGSVEIGKVSLPYSSPSGVFHLFPGGSGYRMVILPSLAIVEWDESTNTVRTWPGLDASPPSVGSVRPEGNALRIAYADHGPVSRVWMARVEQGAVTERITVAQAPAGHTVAGVALYPTSTGYEVLWNEYDPGSGGLATHSASIAGGKVSITGQVTDFDVRHWALRSGQIGVSASLSAPAATSTPSATPRP